MADAGRVDHPAIRVEYHEFSRRPLADSCWSTQTGPDGCVYHACCVEHTGGETVTLVRHDEAGGGPEYLFDMDVVTGDLRDSGRATQCKIHYSMVPEAEADLLHCATHLSGPPKGERSYNPWGSWQDPARAFRGSFLVGYDTGRDQVHDVRLFIPKEGCRCLCLDPRRRRLYAVTYPRDHFVRYDLVRHELHDLGRLGSVNTQCLFADDRGRIHTFIDSGRMIRYDPDADRIEELPWTYPHDPAQTPWHGVIYDAVRDLASTAVYMVPWKSRPRLARFWPDDGPHGRLEDLGPLTGPADPRRPHGVNQDHVGGLVFGADGMLYFVRSERGGPADGWTMRGMLCRLDPRRPVIEPLCTVQGGNGPNFYVARAAMDAQGTLFMGKILARPAGYYRIRIGGLDSAPPVSCLRTWG
jgi:hypothetical protein